MAGEGEARVFVIQGIEFRPCTSYPDFCFPPTKGLSWSPLALAAVPPRREPTPEGESDDDDDTGNPSNRAVLNRLAEVEGKLDRVLAALASK
jgi:hypothetical protein